MSITTKRMVERVRKIRIEELNPHLVCVLCGGYYIDATTIIECLHSFCKTCIVRYLETSKYCPICDVQVHKTKPLVSIRSDQTLQDLVYKLVPGLFTNEMHMRKEYYAKNKLPSPAIAQSAGESAATPNGSEAVTSSDGTSVTDTACKASSGGGTLNDDEMISLSLEYSHDGRPVCDEYDDVSADNSEVPSTRYLLCPAAFTIGHLKKFVRTKFNLELRYEIDVFHIEEPLSDLYTLMDIAYIYTWRRRGPLRLFYSIYEVPTDNRKRKLNVIPEVLETEATSGINKAPTPAKVAKETPKATLTPPEKVKNQATQNKGTGVLNVPTVNSSVQSVFSNSCSAPVKSAVQVSPSKPAPQPLATSMPPQQHQQPILATSTVLGTVTAQTFLGKPAEPPVKRKVGRPPKNPKTGPVKASQKPKLPGMKKPPAPLLKLATSQAKLISSNQKSPISQSRMFPLSPRMISPPLLTTAIAKSGFHDNSLVTSSTPISAVAMSSMTSTSSAVKPVVQKPSALSPNSGSSASVAKSATTSSASSAKSTSSVLPAKAPSLSPKKSETKKSETKKSETKKTDTKKTDSKIFDSKKADSKPKCINTISNKLLASQQEAAAKVTEASVSPSRSGSVHKLQLPSTTKPVMSSQGTSPMSPVATLSLSPGKPASSPLATTPNRSPVKSTSSSTQTGTPPHGRSSHTGTPPHARSMPPGTPKHDKCKQNTTSVSVATSPIATKSPSSGGGGSAKESPSRGGGFNNKDRTNSVKSPSTPTLPPTKLVTVKSPSHSSPGRNLFQEILGVAKRPPKVPDSTSQTPKTLQQMSPVKHRVSVATSPGKSPNKTSPPVVGTKRDAGASAGGMSPPAPGHIAAHRPHIAAAVAPTPPKRPYLPVASATPVSGAGQITPPLRLKISPPAGSAGSGGTSALKSPKSEVPQVRTSPGKQAHAPQAHSSANTNSNSSGKSNSSTNSNSSSKSSDSKDKKSSSAPDGAVVEARGPEQEVPLDLGTRKSVPVK